MFLVLYENHPCYVRSLFINAHKILGKLIFFQELCTIVNILSSLTFFMLLRIEHVMQRMLAQVNNKVFTVATAAILVVLSL